MTMPKIILLKDGKPVFVCKDKAEVQFAYYLLTGIMLPGNDSLKHCLTLLSMHGYIAAEKGGKYDAKIH